MTTTETTDRLPLDPKPPVRRWYWCAVVTAFLLLVSIIVVLILAFTVFKAKDPTTRVTSIKVSGISPSVSLPALDVELNVSLNLDILVQNPNRASFRHGPGKSFILYRQIRVGEADLHPGRIPARGSESIGLDLTIEAEKFGSDLSSFLSDVLSGEVGLDTAMRIPGKVTVLRIFNRNAVAALQCHVDIGFPNLTIHRQVCQNQFKV